MFPLRVKRLLLYVYKIILQMFFIKFLIDMDDLNQINKFKKKLTDIYPHF